MERLQRVLGNMHGYVLSRSVEVPGQQPGQALLDQVTTQQQLQAVQAHLEDLQEVSPPHNCQRLQ